MYTEHHVTGLKQAIGKQANLKVCALTQLKQMNKLFSQSIGEMLEMDVATDKIDSLIWQYQDINKLWWKGESEHLGVLSTIADYTNKRGVTSKAHYTQNGKYLKPAKEGDQPISYEGHFRITKEKFEYDVYMVFSNAGEGFPPDEWFLEFIPKRGQAPTSR
jgi:hypothetical protein